MATIEKRNRNRFSAVCKARKKIQIKKRQEKATTTKEKLQCAAAINVYLTRIATRAVTVTIVVVVAAVA